MYHITKKVLNSHNFQYILTQYTLTANVATATLVEAENSFAFLVNLPIDRQHQAEKKNPVLVIRILVLDVITAAQSSTTSTTPEGPTRF